MWDLSVSVPDHCLSLLFINCHIYVLGKTFQYPIRHSSICSTNIQLLLKVPQTGDTL